MQTDLRHEGGFKGFHHMGAAWFAKVCLSNEIIDEITIGWYYEDGGTTGEFTIQWKRLGSEVSPCVRVWDDAWHCFASMPELFAALANLDTENTPPEEICTLLLSLGYKDCTARQNPNALTKSNLVLSAKAKLTQEELEALLQCKPT